MLARARLQEERKAWRRDHPFGFVAKPSSRADGTQDLFTWDFDIPAKADSIWHPGVFGGKLVFDEDYPHRPPIARFDKIGGKNLFHPNVFSDGQVCLSIINPPESKHGYGTGGNWSPSFGVRQVLVALQRFLDETSGFAQGSTEAYELYHNQKDEYVKRVKKQVAEVLAARAM